MFLIYFHSIPEKSQMQTDFSLQFSFCLYTHTHFTIFRKNKSRPKWKILKFKRTRNESTEKRAKKNVNLFTIPSAAEWKVRH